MGTLSVEFDDETVRALEVERELIGFESRTEYVRWIVNHRGAIDAGSETRELLKRYRERVTDLESQLEEARDASTRSGPSGTEQSGGLEPTARSTSDRPRSAADGGWTQSALVESTEADQARASTDAAPSENDDGGWDASVDSTAELDAVSLKPERVARIRDDAVSDDADVLGSVAAERLDELSRRAVAKTRRQLNRDVETGLVYRSTSDLADGDDVRPGEDLVDIDELSLPGHEAVLEDRRELAGRALALLRDVGRARRSTFVDELYEAHPAGYDTADGWWRCVKTALEQVDGVDHDDGSPIWRWDG